MGAGVARRKARRCSSRFRRRTRRRARRKATVCLYVAQRRSPSDLIQTITPCTVISTRTATGWSSVEPTPSRSLPEPPQEPRPASCWAWNSRVLVRGPLARADRTKSAGERPVPRSDRKDALRVGRRERRLCPVVTPADDETGEPFGGKAPGLDAFPRRDTRSQPRRVRLAVRSDEVRGRLPNLKNAAKAERMQRRQPL